MSLKIRFLLLLAALFINGSRGANILAVFSCPSPSHLIVEISMAKVLAENGHNVTVITTLIPHVTHKNLNLIYVPLTEEEDKAKEASIAGMVERDNSDLIAAVFRMRKDFLAMFDKSRDVMKDPRVRDLYENKDNKFDLVMVGYFFNTFQIGIAQKLKVPVVIVTSMFQSELFDPMLGDFQTQAYVPTMGVSVEKGKSMGFGQRLKNYILLSAFKTFVYLADKDNAKYYEELYGDDPTMPKYEDLNKNISLVLFNSHGISEGPIRPNFPGAIEVGGIQIKEKPDPLPKPIADFLQNATHGAILLSLGSNLKGAFLKPDTVQKMFNVLSKLKQKIIWKWEDLHKTPGKSDNILYSKWLPQDDILAHPNIKLFINHAGRGGITESQFHGKPMLSLPVFGDQPANAEKMVKDGFGLSMSLLTLEEKPFHDNIKEVLDNPKYTEKVKAFSQLFRDRPLTARQTVLYWVEYVLRHHGAAHLQSPLVHMSFIAANNLDIYALLSCLIALSLFVFRKMVKCLYKNMGGKPKNASKVKKTKKILILILILILYFVYRVFKYMLTQC
ncbi:UDP-glucuronosyltransferase 2B15-like [Drosophila navojoa]|uniref:UDP-glucuronosyltransferase 2B15-like n=1 Tax=Drosophila navojoa TaxID=7232 RepID=UPI0011BDED97|nr:UDP-glucuronosyltransferase 2B15-like [Drosophila navojoa]